MEVQSKPELEELRLDLLEWLPASDFLSDFFADCFSDFELLEADLAFASWGTSSGCGLRGGGAFDSSSDALEWDFLDFSSESEE